MMAKWRTEYDDHQPFGFGMPLVAIKVDDHNGSHIADHNMPCPVCENKKAVLFMNTGRFHPCWDCTREGWVMIRLPSWILRWFPFLRSEIQE